jgi:hypothetical protein
VDVVGRKICAAAARSQTQVMQSIATHSTDQAVCDEATVAVIKGPVNVFTQNEALCCSLQCTLLVYKVIFLMTVICYFLLLLLLLCHTCGWLAEWATLLP